MPIAINKRSLALAVIVADLAENTTQAIALAGNESLIGLKDVLTPLKFGLGGD